jgi:soluble lytic murein transglycosylase-like protein
MSAEPSSVAPVGAQAAEARIAQLQALIAQAGQSALGRSPETSAATSAPTEGTSFSSALAQAGSTPTAYASSFQPALAEGQSSAFETQINQAAQRYGLDPAVLHGLIQQESGFDPSARSSAGAAGLTQLMPGTASSMGVVDPMNPTESIEGGARYLSGLMSRFGGNTTEALAAYNAGPGAVEQFGGVPPYSETQTYVAKVLGYAEAWRQSNPSTSAGMTA